MVTIHQQFYIQSIKIDNLSNSSVFQVGTSGQISAYSNVQPFQVGPPSLLPATYEPVVVPLPNP